jgi:uncharacterized protein YxeA
MKKTIISIISILLCLFVSAQNYNRIKLGSDSIYTYITPFEFDSLKQCLVFQDYDSLPDGKWIIYRSSDTNNRIIQKYTLDILDSTVYLSDNNTTAIIGYYKNQKKDGLWIYYWTETRPMIKVNYKNGNFDGRYIRWYDNGQIAVDCTYKNGILNGTYKTYSQKGEIEQTILYADGKIVKNTLLIEKKRKKK